MKEVAERRGDGKTIMVGTDHPTIAIVILLAKKDTMVGATDMAAVAAVVHLKIIIVGAGEDTLNATTSVEEAEVVVVVLMAEEVVDFAVAAVVEDEVEAEVDISSCN